jgi:hypothetical protein
MRPISLAASGVGCTPRCRLVAPRYGRNGPASRLLGSNACAPEAETRTRTGASEPVLHPPPSAAARMRLLAWTRLRPGPRCARCVSRLLRLAQASVALDTLLHWTGAVRMAASRSPRRRRRLDDLTGVHPFAAGLAIGSEAIVVAVPASRDPEPVRVFGTVPPALHLLVAFLVACGIDTGSMESRRRVLDCDLRVARTPPHHALFGECPPSEDRPRPQVGRE